VGLSALHEIPRQLSSSPGEPLYEAMKKASLQCAFIIMNTQPDPGLGKFAAGECCG